MQLKILSYLENQIISNRVNVVKFVVAFVYLLFILGVIISNSSSLNGSKLLDPPIPFSLAWLTVFLFALTVYIKVPFQKTLLILILYLPFSLLLFMFLHLVVNIIFINWGIGGNQLVKHHVNYSAKVAVVYSWYFLTALFVILRAKLYRKR